MASFSSPDIDIIYLRGAVGVRGRSLSASSAPSSRDILAHDDSADRYAASLMLPLLIHFFQALLFLFHRRSILRCLYFARFAAHQTRLTTTLMKLRCRRHFIIFAMPRRQVCQATPFEVSRHSANVRRVTRRADVVSVTEVVVRFRGYQAGRMRYRRCLSFLGKSVKPAAVRRQVIYRDKWFVRFLMAAMLPFSD